MSQEEQLEGVQETEENFGPLLVSKLQVNERVRRVFPGPFEI